MNNKKIITLILIIAWMTLIFYFSNQIADDSSKLSGGITRAILNFFHMLDGKTIEEQAIIETVVRKLAHFSLYAVGGILISLHVIQYKLTKNKQAMITWLIGTIYATTDEIHQLFVSGRSGEIRDVCIDSLGIIIGILIILTILKIIKRCTRSSTT